MPSSWHRDALNKMNDLTKRLEVSLGPDTGDLSMRFGLHSGPVTAGVLRGTSLDSSSLETP
jgi:class 3 adenylate cyclase